MACAKCKGAASLRCGRCKTVYCSVACQKADWKAHKAACGTCIICFEAGAIESGCACRGEGCLAHIACRGTAAAYRYADTDSVDGWATCATCTQPYTGAMMLGLAEHWCAEDKDELRVVAAQHLANAYVSVGRYAEANKLYDDALVTLTQTLGPEHENTVITANNIGQMLEACGYYDTAEAAYRRCSAIAHRVFGPEYRLTLLIDSNIGSIIRCQGKSAEAERIFRDILAIMERAFGRDDVDTVGIIHRLATVLPADEAFPLYEEVHATRLRVLGPKHPNTLAAARHLSTARVVSRRLATL
jgi:tetratricopeptide (TPR) repeat protein